MEQKVKVKCDNCRKYIIEEQAHSCFVCGAIVCFDCISDDYIIVCKECEQLNI